MITATGTGLGTFILGSFNMAAEALEAEKERYGFIEASHNPCINSFGFPSHPKFAGNNDLTIDMSKFIDDDFLVESIAVEAKITTGIPSISDPDGVTNESLTYAQRRAGLAELCPSGCTFFLLNQRKAFLPIGISQNTFHMESDTYGSENLKRRNIQREGLSIPGWYPAGARQAWTRGTAPASIIYNGGIESTVNSATHADSTGWSFNARNSGDSANVAFDVVTVNSQRRLKLHNAAFITTSTTEDTYHNDGNTNHEVAAPYYMPIPEGYSTSSYLTTSEAYRLRLMGKKKWSGSNTKGTYLYMYVYVTYIDQLLAADADGVRNLIAKVKIGDETDQVLDIPLRSVYDGKDRKFNLHIAFDVDGTFADNYLELRSMEIYKVATSSYVDTIRDVVGWGTVGVFPVSYTHLRAHET